MAERSKVVPSSRPPDPGGQPEINKRLRQHKTEALEQDLLKVKAENVTLYGRIRGYKTLDQMYSQSKDEANTYKRLYEQLLAKDSTGPDSDMTQGREDVFSAMQGLCNDSPDAGKMEVAMDGPDIFVLSNNVVTDAAAGEGGSDHDSDAEEAPTSFQTHSHVSSAAHENPSHVYQSMDSQGHMSMEESIQISQPNSREVNDRPTALRVNISADDEAMAHSPSLSPDSMIFQTQLMGIVKSDRDKLKKEITDTKEKLRQVTDENDNLRQRQTVVVDMERELNQLRAKHQDREGSPSSSAGDWVHVLKDGTRDTEIPIGATGGESVDISPTQKAKIEKMRQKMAKLHRANLEWEEHCKHLIEDNKGEKARLKKSLEDEMKAIAKLKEHEQRRQLEMESLFTSIHRQRSENTDKLEQDLNMEKQRSASYMERCLELEREANMWREQDGRRAMVESFSAPGRTNETVEQLKTEIAVLKLQVTTYKEDFDTEKKDREKLIREKTEFHETMSNILEENDRLRTEIDQKTSEVTRANSQASAKEQEVGDLNRKVQSLEQQLYSAPRGQYSSPGGNQMPTAPGYYGSSYPPPPPQSHHWLCRRCSFRNDGERSFCEMCGNVKYNQYEPYPQIVPHGGGPRPAPVGTPPAYPRYGMSNRPGDLQTDVA